MVRRLVQLAALLLLLAGGLLLDALLQQRPAVELDVGGRDLGYVEGFSAKEWSDALPGSTGPQKATYRWMGAAGTLRLGPVRAGQPVVLRLRMFSGRPAEDPWPEVRLQVRAQLWATFPLAPTMQEYAFILPAEALSGEDLLAGLRVKTFRVKDDTRALGLVVERARLDVVRTDGSFWSALLSLRPAYTGAGLALFLGALALGIAFWLAWGGAVVLLALAAAAAAWRPELTLSAGPTLAVLLAIAAVMAGLVRLAGPRWRSWSRWLGEHATGVLLLLFLAVLFLSFFPHIEADGIEYYAYLRSLAFDGDLHFANELSLETPFPHVPYGLGAKKTITGYEPNFASVGPAIVWAPFFGVGHLLALAGHGLGMPWTLDGYSEPYVVLICFGSTLSALVTLLLGYDLVRRLYGRPLGLLATVATFLGTTLFYYAFYKPDFAHALAACAVTAFVYLWVRTWGRRTFWQWCWLGLVAGFMTALYWIDAIFLLLPALELLWEAVRLVRKDGDRAAPPAGSSTPHAARFGRDMARSFVSLVLKGATFVLAFLLAFSPQMIAWKIIFGKWLTMPQEGFGTPSALVPLDLLLSPLHGLIPWTPLAVLGMLGLFFLAWKKRPWGVFLLVALLLFFLYNASLDSWHGGGTFGLRRLTNAFPFFVLGVAALLEQVRRWRPAAALLVAGVPTFWGLVVLLRYLAYTIPHYPLELEGISLAEFLFAPGNMPLARLPEAVRLSFFVQWGTRLVDSFRPADLGYGIILAILCVGTSWGLWKVLTRAIRG